MKKEYIKPTLYIETFSLSQSIALGGCTADDPAPAGGSSLGTPGFANKTDCGWNMGNWTLWIENPTCDIPVDEDENVEGVCYHNPDGGSTIFSS